MNECCLDKNTLNHSSGTLYEALGVSEEEKEKADNIIDEALKTKHSLSELIESIWVEHCDKLSLNTRIYATVRIATEVFGMYLETIARKLEEEGKREWQDK